MDLLNKTKDLCELYNIKPARSRGQNFLIKEDIYDKIIETANLKKDDNTLEVGPGFGFLTSKLSKKAKEVTAVELDDKLASALAAGLKSQNIRNVKIINQDILNFSSPSSFFSKEAKKKGYKVVANLPYNITSIFLRKILSSEFKPDLMVLMLQKEVAERIIAKPPKMSLLGISVQIYCDGEIIDFVPANNFWPVPEVDSAIIKLKIKKEKLKINEKEFFRLVKIGFSSKRKMLKNNLAAGYHIDNSKAESILKKAGFSPKIRAQELSVKEWIKLLGDFS